MENNSNKNSVIAKNDYNLSDLMSIKNIFGFRSDKNLRNKIKLIDNKKKLIYLAGNSLIILTINTKEQLIIPGTSETIYIQNFCISKSEKYLAISEKTKETGLITIYELKPNNVIKKKRILLAKEINSLSYMNLLFLVSKEKYLIGLTDNDSGSYKLVLWDWEKGKLKSIMPINGFVNIKNIFIANKNDNLLLCYGKPTNKNLSIRSFYVKIDNDECSFVQKLDIIKDFLKNYNKNLVSHCILNDNFIVFGNEASEVLLLNKQYELKSKFIIETEKPEIIYNLINWKKGFLVNGAGFKMYFFERNKKDIKCPYIYSKKIISPKKHENKDILTLDKIDDNNFIIGFENGELLNLEINKSKEEKRNYILSPLISNFHLGEIIDMDICPKKPLIATTSIDCSLKIWNYKNFGLEYNKIFKNKLISISFHPSGLHLAGIMKNKIVLMNLNIDEIIIFKELQISNCRILKFSNGGNYLAISQDSNIQIFSFYKLEFIKDHLFKGHDYLINNLLWSENDLDLYSSSIDGKIMKWQISDSDSSLFNENKEQFNTFALTQNIISDRNYFVTNTNSKKIYLTTMDKVEIKDSKETFMEKQNKEIIEKSEKIIHTDEIVSSLVISNSMQYLIIGTGDHMETNPLKLKNNRGAIKILNLSNIDKFVEMNCLLGGIKKVLVDDKDSLLFVIGFDNSLVIIELKDKSYKLKKENEGNGINLNEEFFYDEDLLRKKVEEIEVLNHKVVEYEKITEKKIQQDNDNREEKIGILKNKMFLIENERKKIVEEIHHKIANLEKFYDQKVLNEDYDLNLKKQKLDKEQKKKLEIEKIKYNKIKEENTKIETKFNQQKDKSTRDYKDKMEKIEIMYSQKIKEIKIKIEKEKKEIISTKKNYENKINEIEKKLDKNSEFSKKKFSKEKKQIYQEKFVRENDMNDCRYQFKLEDSKKTEFLKKKEDIGEEINLLNEEIKKFNIESQKNEIELTERNKTIKQKIERIEDLTRKKEELKKFKFVLDYKIKELKKEKGPKEEEITKMKKQLQNMQLEINQFKKVNRKMKLTVNKYNLKLQGLNNLLKKNQKMYKDKKTFLENFENHISDLITNNLENYKMLKKKLLFLYNNYVFNQEKFVEENVDKKKAFSEQRAYLESCIKTLKEKFMKNISVHKNDNKRIMKENVDLIGAINELKRDKKFREDNREKIDDLKKKTKKEIDVSLKVQKNKLIIEDLRSKIENLLKNKEKEIK